MISVFCLPLKFRCSCIFKYLEDKQQGLGSERLILRKIHTLMLGTISCKNKVLFIFGG
jgi:hypothetical protein